MGKSELELNILCMKQIEQFQLGGLMARCLEHNIAYDMDARLSTISFPHLNNHYLVIIDTVKEF